MAYNLLRPIVGEAYFNTMLTEIITKILTSSYRGVITVTGAGSQGIAWLLSVPGASAFLLEALIPYSREAMLSLLGEEPEQFVSMETALTMAQRAYDRATELAPTTENRLGLACTATIVTNRPKRGSHRACLAAHTRAGALRAWLELDKGRRTRAEEEAVVSEALVRLLACACEVRSDIDLMLLPGDRFQMEKDQ